MDISGYCQRCGKELSDMDRLSGYCSMCGQALPVLAEEDAAPEETSGKDSETARAEAGPDCVEWSVDGDVVTCPLCGAAYFAEDVPDKCERCAGDPQYTRALWVMPEPAKAPFILEYAKSGEQVPLRDGLVLGRESIPFLAWDRYLSRKHAAVHLVNERLFLRDLGSDNGTFVNGERLTEEERELRSGDEVLLDQQRFLVRSVL